MKVGPNPDIRAALNRPYVIYLSKDGQCIVHHKDDHKDWPMGYALPVYGTQTQSQAFIIRTCFCKRQYPTPGFPGSGDIYRVNLIQERPSGELTVSDLDGLAQLFSDFYREKLHGT